MRKLEVGLAQGQAGQRQRGQADSEQGQGARVVPFRYENPRTYPDWLLTIPYPDAIRFVFMNTPVNVVLASQFKSYVHTSPGVVLPESIAFQLSVGMKYMFHVPRNAALIKEAWNDFEDRLRWRIFFSFSYKAFPDNSVL